MREEDLGSDSTDAGVAIPPQLSSARVVLNVGGTKYETLWRTLERHPQTRLGKLKTNCGTISELSKLCDGYSETQNEFFFDREPKSFNSILDFYRTGKLHLVEGMCPIAFGKDLEFWEIDETWLDGCCFFKYQQHKDAVYEEMLREAQMVITDQGQSKQESFNRRDLLWDLFEKPSSSFAAKVISIISIFFILISLLVLILVTIPGFQDCSYEFVNNSICLEYPNRGWYQGGDNVPRPPGLSNDVIWVGSIYLQIIEGVAIGWFTLEYLIRLFSAPHKLEFLKGWMNTVDLIVILPYYITVLVEVILGPGSQKTHKVLQVFRVLRILRIFKLVRYSTGLESLGYTMRKSYKELVLLLLFLGMGILIFSSMAFYAESRENQNFSSIPACFWWAVITMTTVGYGDMYPVTLPGKLIGGLCAVSGILVIAFPVPIIVNNFGEFYHKQKKRRKALKKAEAMVRRAKLEQRTTAPPPQPGIQSNK